MFNMFLSLTTFFLIFLVFQLDFWDRSIMYYFLCDLCMRSHLWLCVVVKFRSCRAEQKTAENLSEDESLDVLHFKCKNNFAYRLRALEVK